MAVRSARHGPMGGGGYRWKAFCRLVYATYGCTCHICYHPIIGGVDAGGQVDHLVTVAEDPSLRFELSNARPAHGGTNRCQDCGHACNNMRGAMPLAYVRRKVATPRPGYKPRTATQPRNPGRDW